MIERLHQLVDADGEEQQAFLAAGLSDAQRLAITEGLRVADRCVTDFDQTMDRYQIELMQFQRALEMIHPGVDAASLNALRAQHTELRSRFSALKEELRRTLMTSPGARNAAAELEYLANRVTCVERERNLAAEVLAQIAASDPILTDAAGQRVCCYGCAYSAATDLHAPSCLWLRARFAARVREDNGPEFADKIGVSRPATRALFD